MTNMSGITGIFLHKNTLWVLIALRCSSKKPGPMVSMRIDRNMLKLSTDMLVVQCYECSTHGCTINVLLVNGMSLTYVKDKQL